MVSPQAYVTGRQARLLGSKLSAGKIIVDDTEQHSVFSLHKRNINIMSERREKRIYGIGKQKSHDICFFFHIEFPVKQSMNLSEMIFYTRDKK